LVQQRCHIPQLSHDEIVGHVKAVSVDAGDPHLVFKRLAERLGFFSEIVVRQALISLYNERNRNDLEPVIDAVKLALGDPTAAGASTSKK
jgi:hypothetical protein